MAPIDSELALDDVEKNAKFSFMEITFLTKVEKSVLNAAGNSGGNLTELKKTTEIDGTQRVFVSGSSMKWSIKKYFEENEHRTGEKHSAIIDKQAGAQISSECNPEKYIDDDLFGYFDTAKKLARYAPVKTSGMISLFNVGPDIDNLVRYSQKSENHSLFDKEVSTNVFRSSWAIELDRIGKADLDSEVKHKVDLKVDKKEKRVKLFLEALFNLWQRTQQTNYLTNTQPDLIVVTFREDKSLVVGDKLSIDNKYILNISALKEILQYHKEKISLAYVASHESFLKNYEELMKLNGELDGKLFASNLIILKQKLLSNEFKVIR
jgi:CRISPR-associated protein Cst2